MDDVLRYTWGQYRVWAKTSRTLKARLTRWSVWVLVLTLTGTALGTMTPFLQLGPPLGRVLPWVAGATLGLAASFTSQLLGDSARESWVKARAVAEALKSECFKYLTGTPPFDTADAATVFAGRASELVRMGSGILPSPLSQDERAAGALDRRWTIDDYIAGRLREQINRFYRPAIARHTQMVRTGRIVALAFGAAAVLLSLSSGAADSSAGSGTWVGALLGTVTTAAAAIAAWFQSGNHLQNALNYQSAVTRLELLEAQRHLPGGNTRLVLTAEAIFQAEHAAWLTQWQSTTPGDSSSAKDSQQP